MNCEQCGKEHDGKFGSGRFCCRSCSNKWVSLHKSKLKSSESLKTKTKTKNRNGLSYEENVKNCQNAIKYMKSIKVPTEKILVYGSSFQSTKLKKRLFEEGYKEYKCEICGISTWMGHHITLHLHHKDGDNKNNKLSNLQILCPNCHSQTDNYGFKGAYKNKNTGV